MAQPAPSTAFGQGSPPPPRGIMPRQQESLPGPMMGSAPGADLPGADPLQILANSPEVQHDLRLNPHQIENLQLASRNFMTQMQETLAPGPNRTPEQIHAAIDAQMAKTQPLIARELSPDQFARLQQIMLQIQGPCAAVNDPNVAGQLSLNPQQHGQAAAICQDRLVQMRAAFQPPAPGEDPCRDAARNREALMRLRVAADNRVLATFSPQQQTMFAGMEGQKLDLPQPMPPDCAMPGRGG